MQHPDGSIKREVPRSVLSQPGLAWWCYLPIMVNRLIREVGYGWAMRISAFLILFLLVVANLAVKSRLPPRPQSQTKEELIRPFKETSMMLLVGGAFFLLSAFSYLSISSSSRRLHRACLQAWRSTSSPCSMPRGSSP